MKEALRLRSKHDRAVAALAIPALGSLVADPLLGLVDTAFVGRIGPQSLAGLGVAVAVFGVAFFIFNFLEYGTTTEVAQAVGAQDLGSAGRAAWTSLALAGAAGIVVSAVLVLAAGPISSAMGAAGGVESEAVTYLMIRALAAPAVLLVRVGHGIYRGHQDTKTPFAVTVGMNGVNLLLDPVLIFGAGMGVAGAAWATVVAQWLGVLVFGMLLYRGRDRYGLSGARPIVTEVRAFLRVGRDLAIRSGSLLVTFTLATAIAARISESAVAAHQVLSQIFLFLALAVDALAVAAQALVGRYLGAGERRAVIGLADRLLVLGVGVGVIIAGLLAVIGPFVGGWFSDDAQVVEAIDGAYWLLVVMQPVAAVAFVWDGVFIGAGDFAFLAGAMAVAGVVSSGVLLAVLPMGWGLPGVWSALVVLMIVRLVILAWRRTAAGSPLRRW